MSLILNQQKGISMDNDINLSLHKANRLHKEVVKKIKEISVSGGMGAVTVHINKSSLKSEIEKELEENLLEQNSKETLLLELLDFENTIKKLIFKGNVKVGVSDLLEDISLVKSKISIAEKIKNQREKKCYSSIKQTNLKEKIKSISKSDEYFDKSFKVQTDTVLDNIPELKKELRNLENSLNAANVSGVIVFQMSNLLKEVFGF